MRAHLIYNVFHKYLGDNVLKSRISKMMKNMQRTLWVLLILTPMVVLAAPVTGSQAASLANNAPQGVSSQVAGLANNAPEGAGSQVADLANNVPAGAGSQARAFVGVDTAAAAAGATGLGSKLPFGQGAGVPDIVTMMLTLDKSFPPLIYMVSAMAYLFGFAIILKVLWALKQYGIGVSMTQQNDLRPLIVQLVVGVLLIFLPSTLKSVLATVYGTDAITGYANLPGTSWQVVSDSLILFVQFVGLVAVVRGLLHLHRASGGQGQQNLFSKGIIHLIGGALSLNIVQAKDILYSTLGLGT